MNMKMTATAEATAALVCVLTLATTVLARPPLPGSTYSFEDYTNNNILGSLPDVPEDYQAKSEPEQILEITHFPNKDIYYPNETIEAECRVMGMPLPTVEWVHGTGSFDNDDFRTNTIMETNPTSLGEVVSKLIIHPHRIPPTGSKRTYTCVAKSGGQVVTASTTVHFNQRPNEKPHLNANAMIKALVGSDKVQIYEYIDSLFDEIGSYVHLPCKTTKKAEIYWLNNKGKQITGQEPRFKLLDNGDLLIKNLQFKDMGTYICIAKDDNTKDNVATFVYPLERSQKKK